VTNTKKLSLKTEKEKQVGRPGHRSEDIIIDFKETVYGAGA
jgi:hypothetical protein